jgi:hypothetical protein
MLILLLEDTALLLISPKYERGCEEMMDPLVLPLLNKGIYGANVNKLGF